MPDKEVQTVPQGFQGGPPPPTPEPPKEEPEKKEDK